MLQRQALLRHKCFQAQLVSHREWVRCVFETLTTYADSVPPLKYGLCESTVNYKARIIQLESQ